MWFQFPMLFILPAALPAALLLWLLFRELSRYRMAKIIRENSILYIKSAAEELPDGKAGAGLDILVSCFGVLLGDKVLPFNMDGIELNKVTIGTRFIKLSYCGRGKSGSVRLLHGGISNEYKKDISKKLSYETGILPEIADDKSEDL